MMRVFAMELRASRLWLLMLPVLVLIDLGMMFGRSREWVGVWPQASAVVQLPTYFLGPLLAAVVAWTAGREWRDGVHEYFAATPRPSVHRHGLQFVAALFLGTIPYVVGAIVAVVASIGTAPRGFLWPGYLILGWSSLLLAVGVGHLLAAVFRGRSIGALIAFPLMLFVFAIKIGDEPLFGFLSGPVQLRVEAVPVAARLLLGLAVSGLAFAIIDLRARRMPHATTRPALPAVFRAIAALAVVAVGVVTVAAAGPARSQRAAPVSPICQGSPRVCMWPDQQKYLADAADMAARLSAAANGLLTVPAEFHENGLRPATQPPPPEFNTIFGRWGIAQGLVAGLYPAEGCQVEAGRESEYFTARFELDQWLTSRAYGGDRPPEIHTTLPVDVGSVGAVLSSDPEAQHAWASARVETMRKTCARR